MTDIVRRLVDGVWTTEAADAGGGGGSLPNPITETVVINEGAGVETDLAGTGLFSFGTDSEVELNVGATTAFLSLKQNASVNDRPIRYRRTTDAKPLFDVLATGAPVIGATDAPLDAELVAGQMLLWLDDDNVAPKLMIKAKTQNGTVVTGELALT